MRKDNKWRIISLFKNEIDYLKENYNPKSYCFNTFKDEENYYDEFMDFDEIFENVKKYANRGILQFEKIKLFQIWLKNKEEWLSHWEEREEE